MDTTTSDGGASKEAQPETTEAVRTEGHNADQLITQDENGTPTMEPVQSEGAEEAVSETTEVAEGDKPEAQQTEETQAPAEDINKFAQAKGFDPAKLSEGERKALEMARNAEKRMHQATEKAKELETTAVANAPLDYTGNPQVDNLSQAVNTLLIQNNVRDFFSNNPEAREYESKMAEIVIERPHLQNDLDALYALAKTDPSREAELKAAGGKQALTNLAQKQQQIPPGANATNSGVYETSQITPQNVFELIDKNDQVWFEKNHEAINKAISGK